MTRLLSAFDCRRNITCTGGSEADDLVGSIAEGSLRGASAATQCDGASVERQFPAVLIQDTDVAANDVRPVAIDGDRRLPIGGAHRTLALEVARDGEAGEGTVDSNPRTTTISS